jgi:hypothetical protein
VTGKNIVIVNKFFEVEARTNILLEILENGKIDVVDLSDESREWYTKLKKSLLLPT